MSLPHFLPLVESLGRLKDRALGPKRGFQARAEEGPSLGASVKGLLLWRTLPALLGLILGYLGFAALYGRLVSPDSDVWTTLLAQFPDSLDPGELKAALAGLPVMPGLGRALPSLVLLAPVMVLSQWLHDATFDHMALWMLGGLKGPRSFRISLVADAEALQVGVLGAIVGFLADLPGAGLGVTLLLIPVAVYFWIIRGYALAAWHGCPPWKGITATLLNVVLAVAMVLVLLLACAVMVILLL